MNLRRSWNNKWRWRYLELKARFALFVFGIGNKLVLWSVNWVESERVRLEAEMIAANLRQRSKTVTIFDRTDRYVH